MSSFYLKKAIQTKIKSVEKQELKKEIVKFIRLTEPEEAYLWTQTITYAFFFVGGLLQYLCRRETTNLLNRNIGKLN